MIKRLIKALFRNPAQEQRESFAGKVASTIKPGAEVESVLSNSGCIILTLDSGYRYMMTPCGFREPGEFKWRHQ